MTVFVFETRFGYVAQAGPEFVGSSDPAQPLEQLRFLAPATETMILTIIKSFLSNPILQFLNLKLYMRARVMAQW